MSKSVAKEVRNSDKLAAESRTDEKPLFVLDSMRMKWDEFSLKSDRGSWIVKAILSLIIFFSLRAMCCYGMQFEYSAINALYKLIGSNDMVFIGCEALVSVIWMFTPGFGTVLYALAMFCSLGGLSPVLFMVAALGLLIAGTESRAVTAAAMLMPVFTICLTDEQWTQLFGETAETPFMSRFLLTCGAGIFIMLVASYTSVRMTGGAYRSGSFICFSVLAISLGMFGKIYNADGKSVVSYKTDYWETFYKNDYSANKIIDDFLDYLMMPAVKAVVIFIILSIIFIVLLNLKIRGTKIQVDLRDAIAFAVIGVLLCLVGKPITSYAGFDEYSLTAPSVLVQTALAYVFTRPIAGRIPTRVVSTYSGKRNYIFISYAHNDIERVKPYLRMLKEEGYDYWYDDSIRTGSEWQGVIASNLADCSCFFAFISKSSIVSDYCLKEINYATSKNKPIAVILLDDVPLPPVLEMHLASLQAVQRSKFADDEACMQQVFELEAFKYCKN